MFNLLVFIVCNLRFPSILGPWSPSGRHHARACHGGTAEAAARGGGSTCVAGRGPGTRLWCGNRDQPPKFEALYQSFAVNKFEVGYSQYHPISNGLWRYFH
jgi:hypothetical protein